MESLPTEVHLQDATQSETMSAILQDKLEAGSVYIQTPTEHETLSCFHIFIRYLCNWFCK